MKKMICFLIAACLTASLTACGTNQTGSNNAADPSGAGNAAQSQAGEWSRAGLFADENNRMLSVSYLEDVDKPGWYAGFSNGEDPNEDSYGGTLAEEGNTLHGVLKSNGSKGALTVTISEEGEDGLVLAVEGGETFHFTLLDITEPFATLDVNTEGIGTFTCVEAGKETGEVDGGEVGDDFGKETGEEGSNDAGKETGEDAGEELGAEEDLSSVRFGLDAPKTYVLTAKAGDGWYFDRWMLNGAEHSNEAQITVEVTENTELIAVFEFAGGEDGQNPVMNVIGEYASDRAKARVECEGDEDARITIEWGGSDAGLARWVMSGRLDTDTMTVEYDNCVKTIVTYGEDGKIAGETTEYENGTGSIVFGEDNTFTWKSGQPDEEEMFFEWSYDPVEVELGSSEIYSPEDLDKAAEAVRTGFADFEGCMLHRIRYAGDESCTEENLKWLNELNPDGKYTQVAEFLTDFYSPVESGAWEADTEYTDYQWWLARTDGGDWEVVSRGYN